MLYSFKFYIKLLQNYIKRLFYYTWMDPKLGLIMRSLIILYIDTEMTIYGLILEDYYRNIFIY